MRINLVVLQTLFVSFCLLLPKNTIAYQRKTPGINRLGHSGLLYCHSAHTMGAGRLVIGFHADYSGDNTFVQWAKTATQDVVNTPQVDMLSAYPIFGIGLSRFFDLTASFPLYIDHVGVGNLKSEGANGDLEISGKLEYPPYKDKRIFNMAYYGAVSLPTGSSDHGFFPRHYYYFLKDSYKREDPLYPGDSIIIENLYTSSKPEVDVKMLWTLDFGGLSELSQVLVHINYGVRFLVNYNQEHVFLFSSALEYQPVSWMALFGEFSAEPRFGTIDKGFNIPKDPIRFSPGITLKPIGGMFITLGGHVSFADASITRTYREKNVQFNTRIEPKWRVAGALGWAGFVTPQDADNDGVTDSNDRCPKDAEDLDNFDDNDGCPEPDNDNDGILDLKDKCPNEPEDFDGFNDDDGCPEPDNDNDGIDDTKDKCSNVMEDKDGFEDNDGCPDLDNDKDGISDTLDKCPTLSEDIDGFEDDDGCPDLDNDADGVLDSIDKCPALPGSKEDGGCPKEKPKPKVEQIKRGSFILSGVNFQQGSATLTSDSYTVLETIVYSLKEYHEIKLEIKGHTDALGDAAANKSLSQRRADAVRNFFISRGIAPERLIAIGMGEEQPIADNTTAEGRATNRRVEIRRID